MYSAYFEFFCFPFENTLDQRFLFMSECHREVLAALLYFTREKKGFALVSGDIGTGKTMIVRHFLDMLPQSVMPILIPYPDAEYIEILRYIAGVLGIGTEGKDVLALSDQVKAALIEANSDGKQVVLIIDEAHLLPVSSLENIRLLSNIELTENKLLQILLIGQSELAMKLRKPELRQLQQRININRVLSPMGPAETIEYINHRLRIAESSFDACFEPSCKKLIYKMTGGVPRRINRLCDTALLICMTYKSAKVTKKILKRAQEAIEGDSNVKPAEAVQRKWFKPIFVAGTLVLLLSLGFIGYAIYGRHNDASVHRTILPEEAGQTRPKPGNPVSGAVPHNDLVLKTGVKRSHPAPPHSVVAPAVNPAPPHSVVAPAVNPPPPHSVVAPAVNPPPPHSVIAPAVNPARVTQVAPLVSPEVTGNVKKGAVANKSVSSAQQLSPPPTMPQATVEKSLARPQKLQAAQPPVRIAVPAPKSGTPNTANKGPGDVKPAQVHPGFIVITVKKGDFLTKLAVKYFPEDVESGFRSIVAANPQIHDKNRILVDQTLKIPRKD